MKKKSNKEKKKSRKLLFQIGVVTVPLVLIMVAAVVLSMIDSTLSAYTEAQQASMEMLLNKTYNSTFLFIKNCANTEWFMDYWEKNPDTLTEKMTQAEYEAIYHYSESPYPNLYNPEIDHDKLPLLVKSYYAKYAAYELEWVFELELDNSTIDSLFLIDIKDPYAGLLIHEYDNETKRGRGGEMLPITSSSHSVLQKAISEKSDSVVFERASDLKDGESYYIGYKIIMVDNEPRAVLGVAYKWDDFISKTTEVIKKTAAIGLNGLVNVVIIISLLVYFKAVRPLTRIQKIVCEYIETKDSETVISKMHGIKQRNEFGILAENISTLAGEIDHYTKENVRLAAERERVSAELDMARRIQAEQLPSVFPPFPDRTEFDIFASMTPAKEVGGDFYDLFLIDPDHLALVMADVSGKGIPAALFMMMAKMLINNYATMGLSPHEVLEHTNNTICKNNKQKMFVTVWFGILEISTGKVTAANAGHEYPIIRQPNGSYELFKDKHGFVLGGLKNKKYTEYEFTLEKGGTLFVYTDGVPEATNAAEEMFGTERLLETLNSSPEASPEQLLNNVHNEVNRFVGDAPRFDDLTMLAIKLN